MPPRRPYKRREATIENIEASIERQRADEKVHQFSCTVEQYEKLEEFIIEHPRIR